MTRTRLSLAELTQLTQRPFVPRGPFLLTLPLRRCNLDAEQRSHFIRVAAAAAAGAAAAAKPTQQQVQVHALVLDLPAALCAERAAARTQHEGGVQGPRAKRIVFSRVAALKRAGAYAMIYLTALATAAAAAASAMLHFIFFHCFLHPPRSPSLPPYHLPPSPLPALHLSPSSLYHPLQHQALPAGMRD